MMQMNKRGMSMAIQIFIVLFVLLAVAMLVLQLVSEQTEQQTQIMSRAMAEQKLKAIKGACKSACECGSLEEKVGYCLTLVNKGKVDEGKLDLTADGFTDAYAEPPEAGGLYGLCEDKVYCSQLTVCDCGNQKLTMETCFNLICSLWGDRSSELMPRFFPDATCDMEEDQMPMHWSWVYLDEMSC